MIAQTNKCKMEWNNEELVEHNLTHNLTEDKRHFLGRVEFLSPFREMTQQESSSDAEEQAVRNDARDCTNKLLLICIAQQASEELHRANSNVATRIAAATAYHVSGETLSSIGERQGKSRAKIGQFKDRFINWSAEHCDHLLHRITPELLIDFCAKKASASLADTLDDLRINLTEILHNLMSAAEDPRNDKIEVFLDEEHFKKSPYIAELLATI